MAVTGRPRWLPTVSASGDRHRRAAHARPRCTRADLTASSSLALRRARSRENLAGAYQAQPEPAECVHRRRGVARDVSAYRILSRGVTLQGSVPRPFRVGCGRWLLTPQSAEPSTGRVTRGVVSPLRHRFEPHERHEARGQDGERPWGSIRSQLWRDAPCPRCEPLVGRGIGFNAARLAHGRCSTARDTDRCSESAGGGGRRATWHRRTRSAHARPHGPGAAAGPAQRRARTSEQIDGEASGRGDDRKSGVGECGPATRRARTPPAELPPTRREPLGHRRHRAVVQQTAESYRRKGRGRPRWPDSERRRRPPGHRPDSTDR